MSLLCYLDLLSNGLHSSHFLVSEIKLWLITVMLRTTSIYSTGLHCLVINFSLYKQMHVCSHCVCHYFVTILMTTYYIS